MAYANVPTLSDFDEVDEVPPLRNDPNDSPYKRLVEEFKASDKMLVCKRFNSDFEAQRFVARLYQECRKAGGVRAAKRGDKVYLVREG